jgi:hypothetical protein
MAMGTYSRPAGTGLTPEEMEMLEEAEKRPQVYDDDCPKLTREQLSQFRPVNYSSMEERARAMRAADTPPVNVPVSGGKITPRQSLWQCLFKMGSNAMPR